MKNKIVGFHPIIGTITISDILDDLNKTIQAYEALERHVQDILEYCNYDEEIIASLFSYNIAYSLKEILYVLNENL